MGKRSRSRSRSNHKDSKKDKKQIRSRSKERKEHKQNKESTVSSVKDAPLRDSGNSTTEVVTGAAIAKVDKLWEKIKEEKLEEEESMLKVQQKYGLTKKTEHKGPEKLEGVSSFNPVMIEVIVNDRLGKKERIKCLPSDTIGILKKLIQAKTGTRADKIKLQKQHQVFKDHITLDDYEIHDGMSLEMYYN